MKIREILILFYINISQKFTKHSIEYFVKFYTDFKILEKFWAILEIPGKRKTMEKL